MSSTDRVLVVGSPGLDTLVLLAQDHPDLSADGHFTRNVDTVGHAAAFCARAMARLGHPTRILGSVGDDAIGALVREVLEADGVDTSLLFCDPAGTARSVNFVFPDGRRTFFLDAGSHLTLRPPQLLVEAALADTDLVVSSLPAWAPHVLAAARAAGIPVAVDLQDVRSVADPYRVPFVASADHLFASAAHVADPAGAARAWLAAGPARTVVLGQGPTGATMVLRTTGDQVTVVHQPPAPVPLPIVDTTGAGDGLAVGFLDGLLFAGAGEEAALHRGQVLARIVASDLGAHRPFDRHLLDLTSASAS